ncbi:MAG: hypothetical protein JWO58_597 [Chitinophagaceae bacterium]|nr:hypothetical protein [Chitinophagaceae bacterium]
MSYQNLSVALSDDQKNTFINQIIALKSMMPFLIHLSPEERKSLRKVAEKRQGYVHDVVVAVKANSTAIPQAIDTVEFFKDAQLFLDLSEIMAQIVPLYEALSDTFMAAGNEAITVSDQCYGFLKQAARGNSHLTNTVQELSKHFAKKSKPAAETPVTAKAS